MHLTVIVPTWKRLTKLQACLKSLEDQLILPDLVIVTIQTVDIETQNYLTQWARNTKLTTKILELSAPGVVHAENEAIKFVLNQAVSEIVTFMDDDAIAFEDWIKKIKIFFETHSEAAALGGPDIIVSEPWSYHDVTAATVGKITFYGKVIGNHHRKSTGLREVDALKGVNMSFRRKYLNLLDPYLQGVDPAKGNGVFWELDLCLSVHKRGKIYFDPSLLIQHDSNHSHMIKDSVVASTAHNLTYVMLKHIPWYRKIIFLLYSLLIGNSHIQRIVKTLVMCMKEKSLSPLRIFRISVSGLRSGLLFRFNVNQSNLKVS